MHDTNVKINGKESSATAGDMNSRVQNSPSWCFCLLTIR